MRKSFCRRFPRLCWSIGMSVGYCLDHINYFSKTHFNYWTMIPRAGILDYVNGVSVQSTTLIFPSGFSELLLPNFPATTDSALTFELKQIIYIISQQQERKVREFTQKKVIGMKLPPFVTCKSNLNVPVLIFKYQFI